MQRLLSPNTTSSLQSYSNSTLECLERSDVGEDTTTLISGSVFAKGKLGWLARGSALEVVDTTTGQRVSAWRFGWSSREKRLVTITAVAAFPMGQTDRLVVGLKDLTGNLPGMICLFDPHVSRVIKAVVTPYPVNSIETVMTSGGANASPSLLSLHLKLYFGVIAVGTEQGHTYLVDMRLDDNMETFDEWNPSSISIIDGNSQDVSSHRENARWKDMHIAVELGGGWHKSGKFYYNKSDPRDEKIYSEGDAHVTAIKYIQQAGCLVVGYNFGCFLIWNLSTMALVYTSQVNQYDMSAITHLAYQEPENDPHSCCYLWVARGPVAEEEETIDVPTTLTLYQLVFGSREMLLGYGVVYKDLTGCGRRFEHQLTADAHHLADATSVGSRVISCYTLEREHLGHDVSKVDEGTTRDLTLMVCIWEAPSHDPLSSPTCHLGIFDINRWYHSQMQPSLRDAMFGSKDSTCPFFAFFSMAEILDVASPDGIVDVHINSDAVTRFTSNIEPAQEQYYWPASLKFDACCLVETGVIHSQYLGMQRQILASLHQEGLSGLLDAHSYFNMCWAAGLLPRNFDMSKSQDKNFHLEAILSVCLEHGLVIFITSCIEKLGSQSVGPAGFNLRMILDWSWIKVVQLKEQLDQLSVPLFDGGGGTPDDHMLLLLDDMAVQLNHLRAIFQALLNQTESSSQQGLKDLAEKHNVLSILSMYLKLMLWFIRHGILPDQNVDEEISFAQSDFAYCSSSFKTYYDKRRSEMHALLGDTLSIGLMIDKIVSQFDGVWVSTVGKEQYPPSSLHALCGLYLLDKVSNDVKHSIIFYFLLDLCSVNSDLNDVNVAEQFAQSFDLSLTLTKLMKAIWFLDHKEFENAMTLLVDPALKTKEIGPWQNSFIIKTLLLQGEFQKALHLMKTVKPTMHTMEDVRLHLSVLLANGLITEAFDFQRHHRNPIINADLLIHFFTGCQQNGNVGKVIQLPLNNVEEEYFVDFLKHGSFEASQEILVMYYLQRGRYVEGIRLNEAIKQDTKNEQNPKLLERAKIRNIIVEGYVKCLPSVQRKLIFMPETLQTQPAVKQVPRPKPLSTVVHHVKQGRPVSHASLLNSIMDKVAEARPQNTPQKRRSGPFVGTPLTPKTKGLLNDSQRMVFANVKRPEVLPEEPSTTSEPVITTATLLDKKRRKQLYSGADALTLLTTPRIVKRPSRHSFVNDSITVSTTPQSILKVSRVVRRSTSPRTSPTTTPPSSLRSSLPAKSKQGSHSVHLDSQDKDVVDSRPEKETPSRRIRFATEDDSPLPSSPKPIHDSPKDETTSSPVPMETVTMETLSTPPAKERKGVSFLETEDTSDSQQHVTADSLRLELSQSTEEEGKEDVDMDEEGEPEVQITAAVVDFRGSGDLEEDVIGQEDEDYSSYELDESDNVIAEDSEEEVLSRKDSVHASSISHSVEKEGHPSIPPFDAPLMRSSPQTPVSLSSEDQSVKTTKDATPQPKTPPSNQHPTPDNKDKSTPIATKTDFAMTPPKSPPTERLPVHSPEAQATDNYPFSPPMVLRTPIPENVIASSSTSTDFLFSPPITRSMKKRQSLDVSYVGRSSRTRMADRRSLDLNSGRSSRAQTPDRRSLDVSSGRSSRMETPEVSITGRSLRPRSHSGKFSPHQSPTDSPISFISPAPGQPKSPKNTRQRSAKKPLPKHKMVLRSRLTLRSAKLPEH